MGSDRFNPNGETFEVNAGFLRMLRMMRSLEKQQPNAKVNFPSLPKFRSTAIESLVFK